MAKRNFMRQIQSLANKEIGENEQNDQKKKIITSIVRNETNEQKINVELEEIRDVKCVIKWRKRQCESPLDSVGLGRCRFACVHIIFFKIEK